MVQGGQKKFNHNLNRDLCPIERPLMYFFNFFFFQFSIAYFIDSFLLSPRTFIAVSTFMSPCLLRPLLSLEKYLGSTRNIWFQQKILNNILGGRHAENVPSTRHSLTTPPSKVSLRHFTFVLDFRPSQGVRSASGLSTWRLKAKSERKSLMKKIAIEKITVAHFTRIRNMI